MWPSHSFDKKNLGGAGSNDIPIYGKCQVGSVLQRSRGKLADTEALIDISAS